MPEYAQDRLFLERAIPHIHLKYISIVMRTWTAHQHPLFKLLRFLEYGMKGITTIMRIRPDILIGHDLTTMPLVICVRWMARLKIVYNAHELLSEASENIVPLRALWHWFDTIIVRRIDALIVPETNRGTIMVKEYGSAKSFIVVRNIPPVGNDYHVSRTLHTRLGLAETDTIILYQGLIAASRCLQELVGAFNYLPSHFHLVLIGSGEESFLHELRLLTTTILYPERIHFIQWIPYDLLKEFTLSADIGVLLYRNDSRNNYYAAPNKMYEYLFAGLVVVASDFPGLQSVVEKFNFGICVNPENTRAIAVAIEKAAFMQHGEESSLRAKQMFRWEDDAARLFSLYTSMITTDGK